MASGEIVLAEPTGEGTSSGYITKNRKPYIRAITYGGGRDQVPEPFDSEKLPVTLAPEIQRFLRVANLIHVEEPRVAYICRFHAFEVAHLLDPSSSGRGVRQFKTSLLQRLEQDEVFTIGRRKERTDIRELKRVYGEYKDFINIHGREYNYVNREKFTKAQAVVSVLFQVLATVSKAAGSQAIADRDDINSKSPFNVPYNILPLEQGSIQQAIMQFPEIKASVSAIRNIRGLPFVEDFQKHLQNLDLFDWLQFCFGFQVILREEMWPIRRNISYYYSQMPMFDDVLRQEICTRRWSSR